MKHELGRTYVGAVAEMEVEKPWRGGEPSSAVIPSAISTAVFDATGMRLRTAPCAP